SIVHSSPELILNLKPNPLDSHSSLDLEPLFGDFFFVLIYICCNFSTVNGFSVIKHTRSLLSTVHVISSEYSLKIAPLTSSCWSFRRWTLAEYADGTHRYFFLRSNDATI
ncbi:hypothetical protein PanWU01x14_108900, partial [Parasponia andersonii]